MMLMLNEYKCIDKYTQDPNDISGEYKHVKANMNRVIEIELSKGDIYNISFCHPYEQHYTYLGQGTLHKSPLLGDYIEFEIGVRL